MKSVVIPARDEAGNLRRLLPVMKGVLDGLREDYEIIVVDDGSTDGTSEVANEHGAIVVRNDKSLGKTTALSQGFGAAEGRTIIMFDADFQEEPKEIPQFIRLIEEGYDLVNGWRYPRLESRGKRMQSMFYNLLTTLITGGSVLHDNNCGFKAFRREMLENMDLSREGYHRYMVPMLLKKGCKVCEVKVSHYPRQYGKTKYGGLGRLVAGLAHLLELRFRGVV